ncbi:hypothetical protein DL89DRAFT_75030 [Linderina pennispora]|uniref:Uncharacterized protein n=1 Tax=Linderina pennispora TaxID=61395 RepID=A0A1Y1VYA3_9FUNG|nr:uncharacterized protein DL89DRAFT_75030 [Linderina pennispora]ORX66015.1 hypothetical protein DL89DRAFT_75030 [Linderina pennispora]
MSVTGSHSRVPQSRRVVEFIDVEHVRTFTSSNAVVSETSGSHTEPGKELMKGTRSPSTGHLSQLRPGELSSDTPCRGNRNGGADSHHCQAHRSRYYHLKMRLATHWLIWTIGCCQQSRACAYPMYLVPLKPTNCSRSFLPHGKAYRLICPLSRHSMASTSTFPRLDDSTGNRSSRG